MADKDFPDPDEKDEEVTDKSSVDQSEDHLEMTAVKGDMFDKHLECDLTSKERAGYATDLARDTIDHRETKEKAKDVAKDFASSIQSLESSLSRNSRKVSTGKEMRDVECQWIFNFTEGTKHLVRLDTGEILNSMVKVTDNDRQKMLPLANPEEVDEEETQAEDAKGEAQTENLSFEDTEGAKD